MRAADGGDSRRARRGRAARADDDRIALGKANLAVRGARYDEARQWLDVCLRQRPDDAAVWRARLDWAVAANQGDEVWQCLKHVPAEDATPAQVHKWTAWLAARQGASALERTELEQSLHFDPTDFAVMRRLAAIYEKNDERQRLADLGRRKGETERNLARYQKLYKRNQPRRDAEEMASLAGQLGQPFEARAFLVLAVALDSDRADLRGQLALATKTMEPPGAPARTLDDLIKERLAAGQQPRGHARLTAAPALRQSPAKRQPAESPREDASD